MSQKEITFIILDVGASMYQKYKNDKSRLQASIDSIILLIQQKIYFSPNQEVTLLIQIGILLMGAEENEENMIYIQQISQPNTQLIRDVKSLSNGLYLAQHDIPRTYGGDIFRAVDSSLEIMNQYSKDQKIIKKIFCITNGGGQTNFSNNQIDELCIKMLDQNLQLVGVDFMNQQQMEIEGNTQELQNQNGSSSTIENQNLSIQNIQNQNQKYLQGISQNLGDQFIKISRIQDIMDLYAQLRSRQIPQRCKFKQEIELTKNLKIKGNFQFLVQFFGKTQQNRMQPLRNFKNTDSNSINQDQIIQKKVFIADNQELDKKDLIRAYQYGKKLVPVPEIVEQEIKYEAGKSLKILGFAHMSQIPRESFMSGVDMLLPPENEPDQVAFNSLAVAMHQKQMYGIVRYVYQNNTAPKLACIIPYIDETLICFWLVILPTVEDIRDFQFSSLKESTEEQDQVVCLSQAVLELIKEMDLAPESQEQRQRGKEEILKPQNMINTINQNCYNQLFHRAVEEDETIQPLDPDIDEYLNPEQKIYVKAQKKIKKVKSLFKLKENYIKNKKKKIFWQDVIRNNQQNQELVKNNQPDDDIKRNIGEKDPIKDFKQMIDQKRQKSNIREDLVDNAIQQMQKIIMKQVNQSNESNNYYEQSLHCLIQLRKSCIKEDEPQQFNEFLKTIKEFYLQKQIISQGDHVDFWRLIINSGVSLIMECECAGGVTPMESISFTEDFFDQTIDVKINQNDIIQ